MHAKKQFTKYLLNILIIFFLINFFENEIHGEDLDKVQTTISYGIDGKYKVGKSIPINVEIKNLQNLSLNLDVEVRVPTFNPEVYDAYSTEINLKGDEKTSISIPIKLIENANKIAIVIKEDNVVISENKLIISAGRIRDNEIFMGILTDDLNSLSYFSKSEFIFSNLNGTMPYGAKPYSTDFKTKINNTAINKEIIQGDIKNIEALDIIVINNYNTAILTEEAYKNLELWVKNGGILLFGTGANSAKTLGNINRKYFNYTITTSSEEIVNICGDNLELSVCRLNINDCNAPLICGDIPLVYSKLSGEGEILVSAFDLGTEPLVSFDKSYHILEEILTNSLSKKINNNFYYGNYYPYDMIGILESIPLNEELQISLLLIIFVTYILLVGVVSYLVAWFLNKRQYLWIVIPIISISFTLLLYKIGNENRVNDLIVNKVNTVFVKEGGISDVTSYMAVATKYNNYLKVEGGENNKISFLPTYGYYENNNSKTNWERLGARTILSGKETYYEFEDLEPLTFKNFTITDHKEMVTAIDNTLNFNDEGITGTVKNTSGYNIEKLLVVIGENVWDLGSFNKDEEKNIQNKAIDSNMGLQEYGWRCTNDYYNKYLVDKSEGKEKYKNVLRNAQIIAAASNRSKSYGKTYLFALTTMPIDYGIDFEGKKISEFNSTVLFEPLSIDFKGDNGLVNYPLGYFKYLVESQDGNIYVDTYMNSLFGSGEITLSYEINTNVNIKEIKLGLNRGVNISYIQGQIFIYNNSTKNYDEIKLTSMSKVVLQNIDDYLINNKITLLIKGDNETGATVPQISVSGIE